MSSIGKRLADLEKAVARQVPPDCPLPESTRKLYERVFGSVDTFDPEHFAAELTRGECAALLPEIEGLDVMGRARALVDIIIADLEKLKPGDDALAVLFKHRAVISVFIGADRELWDAEHPPAVSPSTPAPALPGAEDCC